MSLIVIPSLKNSNAGNEIEDIAVNVNNISLIRPFPRSSDRCYLYINGVENGQIILLSLAKLVELIYDKTALIAGVSLIGEESK